MAEMNYRAAKLRGNVAKPSFSTLGEDMAQGGKYSGGSVPHGLANQMGQSGGGYSAGTPVKKLREQMGQ